MVYRSRSSVIDVKANQQILEILFNDRVIFINNRLRCGVLLFSLDRDGRTMFIASADKQHLPILAS